METNPQVPLEVLPGQPQSELPDPIVPRSPGAGGWQLLAKG